MNNVTRASVPDTLPSSGRSYTKIIVSDLELQMYIGIYDHEKQVPQRALVNVEAIIDDYLNWQTDSISQTLSYEDIVTAARDIAEQGHINLVETFAERIAAFCLENKLVQAVTVKVEKPDVMTGTRSVGVEILRSR